MPEPQAAEVLEQDGPEAKDNAEEIVTANADEAGDDPQATATEIDDEIHSGKRLGGWQRKIKKLQEQNEALIATLAKVGGNAQTPEPQTVTQEDKPPVKPQRPKQGDFQTWDAYEAAIDKYETDRDKYHEDNLAYQLRQADKVRQQRSEQQTIANGWAAQVDEAKQEFADFEAIAFSDDVPMSNPMMDAIVTSEFGAKIAYELGKNPAEAERIFKLPPVAAIREIGKIESRIAGRKPAAEEQEEPPAASTKAPRPPVPVRRPSGSGSGEPSDSEPAEKWIKWRNKQLQNR